MITFVSSAPPIVLPGPPLTLLRFRRFVKSLEVRAPTDPHLEFTITSPDRDPVQISGQLSYDRILETIEKFGAGGGSRTRIGLRPAGF